MSIDELIEDFWGYFDRNDINHVRIASMLKEAYELGKRDGANSVIDSITKQEGSMRDSALGSATGKPDIYDGLN